MRINLAALLKRFQIIIRGPGLPPDPWREAYLDLADAIEDASRYATQDTAGREVTMPARKWLMVVNAARQRPA